MSSTIPPSAALHIPEQISSEFEIRMPKKMSINGEYQEADRITIITDTFNNIFRFYDQTYIHMSDDGMRVLTLDYGKRKREIRNEHPAKLTHGIGLEDHRSQALMPVSEAMFVGPDRRKISPESAIWIGRALASPNLERVYYLGDGISHIQGLDTEPKLKLIENPLDCIRAVSSGGTMELGLIEAMKFLKIDPSEAIV